jgi:hypothetical protein
VQTPKNAECPCRQPNEEIWRGRTNITRVSLFLELPPEWRSKAQGKSQAQDYSYCTLQCYTVHDVSIYKLIDSIGHFNTVSIKQRTRNMRHDRIQQAI